MPTMSMSASEAKLTTLIPFLLPASDPKLTSGIDYHSISTFRIKEKKPSASVGWMKMALSNSV